MSQRLRFIVIIIFVVIGIGLVYNMASAPPSKGRRFSCRILRRQDKIHFNLTNGFRVDFSKWAAGNRVKVEGNTTSWVSSAGASDSHEDIQVGDLLIIGGSPGHILDDSWQIRTPEWTFEKDDWMRFGE